MRDANYEQRIYTDTGRGIEQQPIDCPACQGRGENPWEQPCTGCAGEGQILEYVFNDAICDHEVAMCDCKTDFQLGDKGFVFVNDPESVQWLGCDEWEAHRIKQLTRIMAKTDHLITAEEMRAA